MPQRGPTGHSGCACMEVGAVHALVFPAPWPCLVLSPNLQLPRTGEAPFLPALVSRSPHPLPSLPPPLLLGVEIAFQLPFAFPINPDSAIKPAGGAGREAAAERVLWGLSPPHRSHSAPDCFLLRRAQPGRPGRGAGTPVARLPPWRAGCEGMGRSRAGRPLTSLGFSACFVSGRGRAGERQAGGASGRQAGRVPGQPCSLSSFQSSHTPADGVLAH